MSPSPDPRPTAPTAPRRGFLAAGWAKFSDNIIPSLVVAVIAGLVMFTLNQTNDRITRLEASSDTRFTTLEENQQEIAVTLATLIGEFAAFQRDVDYRFDAVDIRFDAIEARLTRLEENQQEIAVTLARLDTRLTKLEENQHQIAETLARLDTRLTRLEENQQEIAVTLARLDSRLDAVVALLEAGGEGGR